MYKIIGGDGNEYGPVSGQQLREWITAGRANLETRARREGETEWKRLADFAEFGPDAPPALRPVGGESVLADVGSRFGAFLLDGLFGSLAILPGGLWMLTSMISSIARNGGRPPTSPQEVMTPRFLAGFLVLLLGALTLFVIQVVLLTKSGQTLGKRVVKIRIVRLSGEKPGFLYAVLLRAILPGLLQLIPFWVGAAFFIVDSCFIFRADRRCLHDFLAGTKVVRC